MPEDGTSPASDDRDVAPEFTDEDVERWKSILDAEAFADFGPPGDEVPFW